MSRVVLFAVALLFVVSAVAVGSTADWSYQFTGQFSSGAAGEVDPGEFGARTGASDGLDSFDHEWQPGAYVPEAPIACIVTAIMGFPPTYLDGDMRAPLLPGQTKTWTVNVRLVQPGIPQPSEIQIFWAPTPGYVPSPDLHIILALTSAPTLGPTEWDLTGGKSGNVSLLMSPFGLEPIANFELRVTAVPEPSGLLALGVGAAAVLRFRVRRR